MTEPLSQKQRAKLASIRRFDQLVAYLRDELDWPIERDSFEDVDNLFYEFKPEELGIDAKNAAKIEKIQRLRPLAAGQPWGIFFVKFEPKRLPVVALRRILGSVALKSRASANPADRQAWAADDLLFVSNFGEGEERRISFAHFTPGDRTADLPTLKVLGWDNLDTPLHLDHVAGTLHNSLHWPQDEKDLDQWRSQWRSAFRLRHKETITTSKELSVRLAELARNIRDRIRAALEIESEKGPLNRLLTAFRESLVGDLDEKKFADMYAQTIAYGLLSARIVDPEHRTTEDFAAHMRTSPFLRELMEEFIRIGGRHRGKGGVGIDFDELGVSEVVELLDDANMEAVVRDFGRQNQQEDPVIHFYEHFLTEYDKQEKVSRGVFYTPKPVVSYIVRSVDELLRTEFGLTEGLADITTWGEMVERYSEMEIPEGIDPNQAFVQILDPATGTGTFLVEVIEVIHATLTEKWRSEGVRSEKGLKDRWNEYVPKHLLPRLHGYELMMAPYAIAHLKIGLKLYETGYLFACDERARIYLTNALEPAQDSSGKFEFAILALAHEANAVNEIKRMRRFTVVIGNPPYSNFGQLNKIPFILDLLMDYKRGLNEKKLNLDDDFVKFLRAAQYFIESTGVGLIGMITNNTYFDGITHRQMRTAVRIAMNKVCIVDLHGSSSKKELCPDGSPDKNVFDIQQGVGLSFWVCQASSTEMATVTHADLWGTRASKYAALAGSTLSTMHSEELRPELPYHFFVPKDFDLLNEYEMGTRLPDMFGVNGPGVKTERDGVSIHWTSEGIREAVKAFRRLPAPQLRDMFKLGQDSRDWKVENAKADVLANTSPKHYTEILYRPFDVRHTWYSGRTRGFIGTPGFPVMRNMMIPGAIAFLAMRQYEYDVPDYCYFFVTRSITECRIFVSNRGIANCFPLFVTEIDEKKGGSLLRSRGRVLNLRESFIAELAKRLGTKRAGEYGLPEGVVAEDIFHYAYAVFHSPGYRNRYAAFLKIDFPRLPLTARLELFNELARLGNGLVALHVLELPAGAKSISSYSGPTNPEVGRAGWSEDTVWIDAAKTNAREGHRASKPGAIGFRGVPENVWDFHIGGYQVCHKWLKDRKGRTLSDEDIAHYQKIIVAISETIRIMGEIDEVIDRHGGWPDAFRTSDEAGLRPEPLADPPKQE